MRLLNRVLLGLVLSVQVGLLMHKRVSLLLLVKRVAVLLLMNPRVRVLLGLVPILDAGHPARRVFFDPERNHVLQMNHVVALLQQAGQFAHQGSILFDHHDTVKNQIGLPRSFIISHKPEIECNLAVELRHIEFGACLEQLTIRGAGLD